MVLHPADRAGLHVRLPAHESTTAQLGAAYPFFASKRLPAAQVLVGQDLRGGPFAHDPFELYALGELTNPNLTVLGQIGRGKSALMKSYLLRQAAFGRQVAVLDPKGEYEALARALGTEPVALAPGGAWRINPLDDVFAGAGRARSGPDGAATQRRLSLLAALASACLRRPLAAREHTALELALDAADAASPGEATLPDVVRCLLRPPASAAREIATTKAMLEDDGREVGLELRRLVCGALAGMFDGPTSPGISPASGSLVLDLSAVYASDALPALMVCAAAWLQAMTARPGARTIVVVDEGWALLADLAVARYFRAAWKLARARGVANIVVSHRASDLAANGAPGSELGRLAEGLLADSETVVCYAQPASELPALAALLGCPLDELAFLPRLRRGVALWKVGERRYLVEHVLGPDERALVDTDGALVGAPQPPSSR